MCCLKWVECLQASGRGRSPSMLPEAIPRSQKGRNFWESLPNEMLPDSPQTGQIWQRWLLPKGWPENRSSSKIRNIEIYLPCYRYFESIAFATCRFSTIEDNCSGSFLKKNYTMHSTRQICSKCMPYLRRWAIASLMHPPPHRYWSWRGRWANIKSVVLSLLKTLTQKAKRSPWPNPSVSSPNGIGFGINCSDSKSIACKPQKWWVLPWLSFTIETVFGRLGKKCNSWGWGVWWWLAIEENYRGFSPKRAYSNGSIRPNCIRPSKHYRNRCINSKQNAFKLCNVAISNSNKPTNDCKLRSKSVSKPQRLYTKAKPNFVSLQNKSAMCSGCAIRSKIDSFTSVRLTNKCGVVRV